MSGKAKSVTKEPKHTLSVLVENKFGVLARIAGLFSARGFNIDSLAVGETEDPSVSRMTIVVKGDEQILEQVKKQLNKLIDVIKVADYVSAPHFETDLALVKVKSDKKTRPEILKIAETYKAKIADLAEDSIIVEATGEEEKIEALIAVLEDFGLKEVCRTGVVAMARGSKSLTAKEKA